MAGGNTCRIAHPQLPVTLQVADLLLHFAFELVLQALGLLRFAADQLAYFFLNFPTDVFCCAFDLILVHIDLLILPVTCSCHAEKRPTPCVFYEVLVVCRTAYTAAVTFSLPAFDGDERAACGKYGWDAGAPLGNLPHRGSQSASNEGW